MASRQRECFVPSDRHVFVRRRVVAHRLSEPAGGLECEVGPVHELGYCVLGEELTAHALARHFPRRVLDAVLANVETQTVPVIGPCAARAIVAAVLVIHPEDGSRAVDELALLKQHFRHAHRGAPARGRVIIILLREFPAAIGSESLGWFHDLRVSVDVRRRHGGSSAQARSQRNLRSASVIGWSLMLA